MPDRLYRSRRERIIGGVAGGIAESLRIDPTIVRVVWILLGFATNGLAIFVYFVLLFLLPEAPEDSAASADGSAVGAASSPPSPSATGARAPEPSTSDGTGALVAGAILVLLGGFFLVRRYLTSIDLSVSWPVIVVGLGVILIIAALRPRRNPG